MLRLPSPSVTRTHDVLSLYATEADKVETPIPVGDEDAPGHHVGDQLALAVETPIPVGDEDAPKVTVI